MSGRRTVERIADLDRDERAVVLAFLKAEDAKRRRESQKETTSAGAALPSAPAPARDRVGLRP